MNETEGSERRVRVEEEECKGTERRRVGKERGQKGGRICKIKKDRGCMDEEKIKRFVRPLEIMSQGKKKQ